MVEWTRIDNEWMNLRLVEEIDELNRNFLYLLISLLISFPSWSRSHLRGRLFCFSFIPFFLSPFHSPLHALKAFHEKFCIFQEMQKNEVPGASRGQIPNTWGSDKSYRVLGLPWWPFFFYAVALRFKMAFAERQITSLSTGGDDKWQWQMPGILILKISHKLCQGGLVFTHLLLLKLH